MQPVQGKSEITIDEAKEANQMKLDAIHRISKTKQFKDMFEEVYFLIVGQSEDHDEVARRKAEALFLSKVIECKACDIVLSKLGFDQMQIEQATHKYKLE